MAAAKYMPTAVRSAGFDAHRNPLSGGAGDEKRVFVTISFKVL
jgi:hypothetical protein